MQHVENDVAALGMLAHLIHGGDVDAAPAIHQRRPVGLDAALFAPGAKIVDQARAPVDHRSEHVENKSFDLREVGHAAGLSTSSFRDGAQAPDPESRDSGPTLSRVPE